MTDNVIQFPRTRAANTNTRRKLEAMEVSRVHYESIASDAIEALAIVLSDNGYKILDKHLIKDFGVLLNMVVAMLYRIDGEAHFLQEPMDEIHDVLKYAKELSDKKAKELFTDDEE